MIPLFLIFGFSLIYRVFANTDPIVLVHGLGGDGSNWQYADLLRDEGFTVHAVNVGKFTSAFHRAAETFAQLKGTVVDYGVCHSRDFGHNRFGKDYTNQGLFPQWDENNKVNFFGHSFGGTTIVLLEKLLREGTDCPEDVSPLFTGGNKNWISSMTTFSGVLAGTTIIDTFEDLSLLGIIETFVVLFGGLFDDTFLEGLLDTDFSQWNLNRLPGESVGDFFQRARNSRFLADDNTDISTFDISVEGARRINAFGRMAYPETFYFSHAAEKTNPKQDCFLWWCGEEYQVPSVFMNILFQPFGFIMGSKDSAPEDRENDGLVNWINQLCPFPSKSNLNQCEEFSGNWSPGKWFYFDAEDFDHQEVTNRNFIRDTFQFQNSAKKLYEDHAARIRALP